MSSLRKRSEACSANGAFKSLGSYARGDLTKGADALNVVRRRKAGSAIVNAQSIAKASDSTQVLRPAPLRLRTSWVVSDAAILSSQPIV
jgi:hypothetical protein